MKPRFAPLILWLCALSACTEALDVPTEPDAALLDASDGEADDRDAEQPPAKDAQLDAEPSAPPYQPPDSWQRVTGNCGITLRAPALVATRSQGIDSCVAGFQGPDCSYSADLGGFSDRLTRYDEDGGFSVETVSVAGKSARLVVSKERQEDQRYFVAIHVPGPFWPDAPRVTLSIAAFCFSEKGRDTARNVLQTVELPEANRYYPLPETASCVGDDIRPIAGYRLGKSCVDAKVPVPGICALGARANFATGSGNMICFVSPTGEYYWAHVVYGEYLAGPGSRHGGGQTTASELTAAEEARCNMLVDALPDAGVANTITSERSYGACP